MQNLRASQIHLVSFRVDVSDVVSRNRRTLPVHQDKIDCMVLFVMCPGDVGRDRLVTFVNTLYTRVSVTHTRIYIRMRDFLLLSIAPEKTENFLFSLVHPNSTPPHPKDIIIISNQPALFV